MDTSLLRVSRGPGQQSACEPAGPVWPRSFLPLRPLRPDNPFLLGQSLVNICTLI